jgi:hypothetical protein
MPWRETLLKSCGPGLLGGITTATWFRALRDNHFAVSPACWLRAGVISLQCVPTSLLQLADKLRFGERLKNLAVPPPVFVLGHWRQGTTHLHNLMTVDQRFAFPNNYQCLFPSSFLTAEKLHSKSVGLFLPERRPMDNVEWRMESPQEDEFALCISSLKSPCMGWVFPRRREYYDRYLTLKDVPQVEIAEWKNAFLLFLNKLTFIYDRPLVLKSPPHTARIKLLLKMFPEAKFVHIHRNPYDVFHSTRKMLKSVAELHRLQSASTTSELDDWILRMYRKMYDAYFEDRSLIPAGQFCEVGFEQLEQDPVGQVRRIYEALQLPDFRHVQSEVQAYVNSISDYRKNSFPGLPEQLRQRITNDWQRSFQEWGYACH